MLTVHVASDLHFRGDPARNSGAYQVLADIWKCFDPTTDYLVVTGDITSDGEDDQIAEAVKALWSFKDRLLLCPGNHDYGPLGNLYQEETARRFDDVLLRKLGLDKVQSGPAGFYSKRVVPRVLHDGAGIRVLALGLNSNLKTKNPTDFAQGELGPVQIAELRGMLLDPQYAGMWVLVYLHHRPQYLGPIMELGFGMHDAEDFIAAVTGRAQVVVFGHTGGALRPKDDGWRLKDTGITPHRDGVPDLVNANQCVEMREHYAITFETPWTAGAYPAVVLHHPS